MGFGHLLFLGFSVYAFKFKSAKQKKKKTVYESKFYLCLKAFYNL